MLFNKLRTAGYEGKPYAIINKTDVVEVYIYDEISYWGVNSSSFSSDFAAIKSEKIDVRVNSPGGDVFEGIAIGNAIERHPAEVTVYVDGVAASISSFILAKADKRVASKGSLVMIHNAWAIAAGDKKELQKVIGLLEKAQVSLVDAYEEASSLDAVEITRLMDEETWFTAEEALEIGLVDRIEGGKGVGAKSTYDLSNFKNAPKIEEEEKPESNMALARARRLDLMSKQI